MQLTYHGIQQTTQIDPQANHQACSPNGEQPSQQIGWAEIEADLRQRWGYSPRNQTQSELTIVD